MEQEFTGRVLGIANKMSHGEALGNTGKEQTTTLEAKINGVYIGKFDNRKSFMDTGEITTSKNFSADYPTECKKYWILKTGGHSKGKPHAEDYLLAALNAEYNRLGGKWSAAYPRHSTQTKDLLSIKSDKTACPNCARNLARFCVSHGLVLREKASILHPETSASSDRTGAKILEDKGYKVRHWTVGKLEAYVVRNDKSITNSTTVAEFRLKNAGSTGKFPRSADAEKGWNAVGLGRKSGGY
ncbi:MAG: hypothetical protein NVV74_15605 [Magnetospirillum sp.]|nr:hypothetical protein [Magnetospirillum sp.]